MPDQVIYGKKGWNTKLIRSAPAWAPLLDDTAGDDFDYGDIRIGHIDTGYVEHSVFGAWSDDGTGEHIQVDDGRNFVDPGRDPRPTDPVDGGLNPGHGTRIGSVMYGFAPGNMIGVAPRAPVVPYRALTSVALFSPDDVRRVAGAIDHAVDPDVGGGRCSVINLSLGARPVFNPLGELRDAIGELGEACDRAYEQGTILVAPLGNNVHDRATYPGKFWRSICAAGVEPVFSDGRLTAVEMWKPQPDPLDIDDYIHIDIWAPADVIFRARPVRRTGATQNEYAPRVDGDGTSYAAAAVAGTAAVWLARRKSDIETFYPPDEKWMLTEAFRKLLGDTHQGEPADAPEENFAGILDAKALVEADLPPPDELEREKRKGSDMWG